MVVRKAANMAGHLDIPLIGVVENMSYVTCPKCGERFELFGKGKLEEMAKAFNTRFLGKLGIDPKMTQVSDSGQIETYNNDEFTYMTAVVGQVIEAAPDPQKH